MKHVVEIPTYLRLEIEVDADDITNGVTTAEIAADIAQEYARDLMPGTKMSFKWPMGPHAVTSSEVVLLCPGEDDTPDVFDATGRVQVWPPPSGTRTG